MKCKEENIYVIGKCERMCSLVEEKLRKSENLLHYYEKKENDVDGGMVVAEFKRSAADSKLAKPEELRTFDALRKTLNYLINRILPHTKKPLNYRYEFIFDRCRAIRQEIVIQSFCCEKTLELLEPMVLFMSYSLYRLSDLPISQFDPKICKQHLYECLLKCLSCYDELDLMKKVDGYKPHNRQIIESIYMLTNMKEYCALNRALRLDSRLRNSYSIKHSIGILLSYHQREHYKIIHAIPKLPHPIVCAIASLQLSEIRKEVFRVFSIAYNSQSLKVPLYFLQRLLIYDNLNTLLSHLKHQNLDMPSSSSTSDAVLFNRKKFDSVKSLPNTQQHFVDQKLGDSNLSDLILLISF